MSNLQVVEHQGQRVLTTQQLAQAYETDVKNISNNFNRNQKWFIEGRDFYKLEGEELKGFKGCQQNNESLKFVSVLYFWTERGANRHCKILNTDRAWQQFDVLEDTYFKVKNNQPVLPQMSHVEITASLAQAAVVQEKQIKQLETTQAQHTEELKEIRALATSKNEASSLNTDLKTTEAILNRVFDFFNLNGKSFNPIFVDKPAQKSKPTQRSKAKFLNATKIGNQLGISAIRVNQLLLAEGLQYPYRADNGSQHWRATEKGQQFSEETSYQKGDLTYYRLKWKNSVLDYLLNIAN